MNPADGNLAARRAYERDQDAPIGEDEPFIEDWRDAMAELRARRGMQAGAERSADLVPVR